MSKKMLIDATHEEETRVAIVENNRLIEFDYESSVRKQIKGGVYLAKVTRVEPSLQAAFVNYGGNRHGFLPFSEIHPDYFRIPVSDRDALLAAQEEELKKLDAIDGDDDDDDADAVDVDDDAESGVEVVDADEDDDDEEAIVEVGGSDKPADEDDADLDKKSKAKKTAKKAPKKAAKKTARKSTKKDDKEDNVEPEEETIGNLKSDEHEKSDEELDAEALEKAQQLDSPEDTKKPYERNNRGRGGRGRNNRGSKPTRKPMRKSRSKSSDEIVDNGEGGKPFRFNLRHKYKIQEVVKRGQIMLIQVTKEERGNKGAAVTTYMSLPGRYCVLMPNSPRGGGVSRKIGNFKDRKRMRDILKDLTIPQGMSVILRTAGVERTKAEIKRDLDYLTRLWNTIREDTLKSSAPALINEEGNLIKRSIRDLYTRDVEDVFVAGDKAYKTAKDFMKMLVPSHAKKVKEYNDDRIPLFHRYNVEKQITEIGEITVQLKSGGSLVINPTEALVSIDVNSGRATKERHIEETALKTNLEAATEVARQLRLRDLGGLVVIDFIDMEERRNNRKVENRLRDALSTDRARIQVGRISSFGLLELSRQRLNPSLTEAQFEKCPHCDGSAVVKTLDYAAISAMRSLEEEGIKGTALELSLNVPNAVAVYILNNKRQMLVDIEERYEFRVHIRVDEELRASEYRVDVIKQAAKKKHNNNNKSSDNEDPVIEGEVKTAQHNHGDDTTGDDENRKKGRRRGRRGGRRHNKKNLEEGNDNNASNPSETQNADANEVASKETKTVEDSNKDSAQQEEGKKPVRKAAKKATVKKKEKSDTEILDEKSEAKTQTKPKSAVKKPKATPAKEKATAKPKASNDVPKVEEQAAKEYEVVNAAPTKKKKGWWNRLVD